MKKYLFSLLMCLFGLVSHIQAQDTTKVGIDSIRISIAKFAKPKSYTQIGLNMSAMVVQLIPFLNRETAKTGPYGISAKFYSGNDAFRMGLGAKISNANTILFGTQTIDKSDDHFNFRVGYERKYSLSKKWNYYLGGDLMLIVGGLNAPIAGLGTSNNVLPNNVLRSGAGLAFVSGIEYSIMPRLSVSTEGAFYIGAGVYNFVLIPPVAIFLNARL